LEQRNINKYGSYLSEKLPQPYQVGNFFSKSWLWLLYNTREIWKLDYNASCL